MGGPHAGRVRPARRQPPNGSLSVDDFDEPLQAGDFSKYPGGTSSTSRRRDSRTSKGWTEPSWRITGSYQFTTRLFTYLTVSRGYKAGGYNDQTGTSGLMVSELTRPVDPEFATNYEIGLKFETENQRSGSTRRSTTPSTRTRSVR